MENKPQLNVKITTRQVHAASRSMSNGMKQMRRDKTEGNEWEYTSRVRCLVWRYNTSWSCPSNTTPCKMENLLQLSGNGDKTHAASLNDTRDYAVEGTGIHGSSQRTSIPLGPRRWYRRRTFHGHLTKNRHRYTKQRSKFRPCQEQCQWSQLFADVLETAG